MGQSRQHFGRVADNDGFAWGRHYTSNGLLSVFMPVVFFFFVENSLQFELTIYPS